MKPFYLIILVLCIAGISYGYWGAFTSSGQSYYDEMEAMKPFLVMVGSSLVLILLVLIWAIRTFLKK